MNLRILLQAFVLSDLIVLVDEDDNQTGGTMEEQLPKFTVTVLV